MSRITRRTIIPVSQVTPFTYRDGETYISLLTRLSEYITTQLHPNLQETVENMVEELEHILAAQHGKYVEGVQDFQRIHDAFMTDVNSALMALNDNAVSDLVEDDESTLGVTLRALFMANGDHPDDVIHANSAYAREHGVHLVADGELVDGNSRGTDNTESLNRLTDLSRTTGRTVYIPAGLYRVDGEVDISGASIVGDFSGYQNAGGTRLLSNRHGVTLNQQSATLSNIRMHIRNIRVDNAHTGLRMTYTVHSVVDSFIALDTMGPSIILGDEQHESAGPIWNTFTNCVASSLYDVALYMGGSQWNNANTFNTCDFRAVRDNASAVQMDTRGGYGALSNIFNNTEIRGDGAGIMFTGQNRSTTLNQCFMETRGPAVLVRSATQDLQINGGVWGSLRNNNWFGKNSFIAHESGQCQVVVNGGWVTLANTDLQQGLSFIHSEPGTMRLETVSEPSRLTTGTGYEYKTGDFNEGKSLYGDINIYDSFRPGVRVQYNDGTGVFRLERNGVQDGADEGVVFYNEDTVHWVARNNGATRFRELEFFDQSIVQGTDGSYLRVYTQDRAPRFIKLFTELP